MAKPSIASQCLALSGLFEAELLTELMLRHWGHPFAEDPHFRNQLLEAAVEVLKMSLTGKELIKGVPPEEVNLVLALWYAEWNNLNMGEAEEAEQRNQWLEKIKHAIPSCFCDQKDLPG
jgi:hypothetical protein